LIGFEELGDTDQFTSSALEFRLKQTGQLLDHVLVSQLTWLSGALPTGQISLANTLSSGLLDTRHVGSGSEDESEDDDDRARRKASSGTKAGGARRGKMGIRTGFVQGDADEDE
jgi:hypothetical protein